MTVVRVALLQMTARGDDQDANLAKGEAFCRRAREMGADIALFPEGWNIGYTRFDPAEPGARERWQARAIGPDDRFVGHFRGLAEGLGMAIGLTYFERWDGAPRNTLALIDRRGRIAMTYAKVHTCDFGAMEAACTPGDDFHVRALDTAAGELRVGAMICYDREFPESARILMLKGAELILTPNACHLDDRRLAQFRTRAFENMVGVAMTNYATPQHNGHSVAFGADGTPLAEADEGEQICLAAFDLDALRAHRARHIWGNAYRRPHRYGLLTAPDVAPPFVRDNGFGEPFERAKR